MMQVAYTVADTDAEGPGRRFALWTQGCTLRCKGCCNPELFGATGGTQRSVADLLAEIASTTGIVGVSILGGEPTEQPDLAELCAGIQALGLNVMVFTGQLLADLPDDLVRSIDLLVDGRFDAAQRDDSRRWIGSRNQKLHVLSEAYDANDPIFRSAQTVEIRLDASGLVVNGWPDLARKVAR